MYKLAPITITLMTTLGILSHEMHIDSATKVAIALPAVMAAAGATAAHETLLSQNYHTHVESGSTKVAASSLRSSLPNVKPPRNNDRKYLQNRKLMFVGGGAASIWPSE